MSTAETPRPCAGCTADGGLGFEISMAFQPIVDLRDGRVWAYEALVRGIDGASAGSVLGRISDENRYAFDQRCRVVAIERAVAAGLLKTQAKLSINFLPNAVYSPRACIQLTLNTAAAQGLDPSRLVFEFTETERMADPDHVRRIVEGYQAMGFGAALDDFGAGYAGLTLLARFQPDIIKLDMELLRGLDSSLPRRKIVQAVVALCADMGVTVIAEGVETRGELDAVRALGVDLVQGYLLARPAFEQLPEVGF